jgi:outer membrane protein
MKKVKPRSKRLHKIGVTITLCISIVMLSPLGYAATPRAFDLLTVYQMAEDNDPALQAARGTELSEFENRYQALANFLPTLSGTASKLGTHTNQNQLQNFTNDIYTLSLNQTIFNYQNWVQYAQAKNIDKQACAAYADVELNLILRTAQAYFDILQAEDALKYATAQRDAFAKFLDQTQQRFNVGLIAITDVQIAKASHDNSNALVIAAANDVENKKQILQQIIGQKVDQVVPLREVLKLPPPDPFNIQCWVDFSLQNNWGLKAAEYNARVSQQNIQLQAAGHLPTVNLVGNVSSNNYPSISAAQAAVRTDTLVLNPLPAKTSALGIQLSVPIFSGGAVVSKTRQAAYLFEQDSKRAEVVYRNVESQTRQAYLGVLSQIAQIEALKQAIVSNQSALDATQASFNVGTRTIVDVLNSQTNLILAQQSYAKARYAYIIQSLTLKLFAGILSPEDICHVNSWLKL